MLPDIQYQVEQESHPLAKTDIWRFNHTDLYARRQVVCIPLTSAHKRARLNRSLKHQHWSVGEWANVMLSDESLISLSSDSKRVTIWRERGARFEPKKHNGKTSFSIKGSNACMGYARETNCSPLAPLKLHYRTEESSPRSLEPFEPTTHSSSHSKYGKSLCRVPGCQR
ncbi:transposable element Tcb2 transposase [Trichonephila clavipes]|nr:transposable element Tcb2 transposase [Trichonephila clavipes]